MRQFGCKLFTILLVATLLLGSCTKSQKEYVSLAGAGTAYTKALDNLLVATQTIVIDANSERFFKTMQPPIRRSTNTGISLIRMSSRLENNLLKEVAGKLDELNDDLNTGISNIKIRIKELNDAIAVINTVSKFLGIAAK